LAEKSIWASTNPQHLSAVAAGPFLSLAHQEVFRNILKFCRPTAKEAFGNSGNPDGFDGRTCSSFTNMEEKSIRIIYGPVWLESL
jgi:hypothetical protein